MTVIEIGSILLGAVVVYITMIFIVRIDKYSLSGLLGIAAIITSGIVVNFSQKDSFDFSWYSIGLAVGFIFYQFVYTFSGHKLPSRSPELDIAKERYAKGDIKEEEFETMKKKLI